ncbi:MAG: transcription antitermination factor NusB [Candidatus Dadabacteria bacterium]
MISRRNIRVKVMQTIYTLTTIEEEKKSGDEVKLLMKHFEESKELLIYLTFFLTEVIGYAETDAYIRSTKHLPTKEDLNVNTKIAGNELLWKIKEDSTFREEVKRVKPEQTLEKELVRKIYIQLTESAEYKRYTSQKDRDSKAEKEIIEFVFDVLLLENEDFISHIEENFINWDDDSDMVAQLIRNIIQKPISINFKELVSQDKLLFAKSLLTTVLEKDEHLQSIIIPKLKNWDPERIASLDMIIMKMGVAEFLYFETIPPKVTINEYIDIAKEYSTQQSGQFVNGILDNIHKELVSTGKLYKKEFKKA